MVDGKPVRGRKTRWGVINVENEQHCDFTYLRNFLTRSMKLPFVSVINVIEAEYDLIFPELTSKI